MADEDVWIVAGETFERNENDPIQPPDVPLGSCCANKTCSTSASCPVANQETANQEISPKQQQEKDDEQGKDSVDGIIYDLQSEFLAAATGLAIDSSTVPAAGFGLFATREFKQGETVCIYQGKEITFSQSLKYPDKRYLMKLGRSDETGQLVFIDGLPLDCLGQAIRDALSSPLENLSPTEADSNTSRILLPLGRFINDIKPNNAEFLKLPNERRADIVALRDIKPGEEISCSYGTAYWLGHKVLEKEQKAAVQAEKEAKSAGG